MAVQATPAAVGSALAHGNWQLVRQGVAARCGSRLGRSAGTRSLHRLGVVYQRPKQRLRKADDEQRAAFVAAEVALLVAAQAAGAKRFCAAAAHCRADADRHGKWVRQGPPAWGDARCPRWGEQASDSSAVCLEPGAVAHLQLTGTSSSATSAACRRQWRAHHAGPLVVIGDHGPAHGGAAVREDLATPDLARRLVRRPADRPECNPDEALGAWARAAVTANPCLGTTAAVQARLPQCFAGLPARVAEVQSRCRRTRQTLAEALAIPSPEVHPEAPHGDPLGASV